MDSEVARPRRPTHPLPQRPHRPSRRVARVSVLPDARGDCEGGVGGGAGRWQGIGKQLHVTCCYRLSLTVIVCRVKSL